MKTTVVNLRDEPYDIYIGRPSYWQNDFKIGKDGTREECIQKFEKQLRHDIIKMARITELRGQRLGCFCKPLACHGDIYVKILKEMKIE